MEQDQELELFTYEVGRVAMRLELSEELLRNVHYRVSRDPVLDVVLVDVFRRIAVLPSTESLEVPHNWWDAVKLRFFPSWLLARFPARMDEIKALYYLPKLPIPERYQDSAVINLVRHPLWEDE